MIEAPTTYILDYNGVQHPNPSYSIWLRLDQFIWSRLFVTMSSELFTKVHDLIHSKQIWECLTQWFKLLVLLRLWIFDALYPLCLKIPNNPRRNIYEASNILQTLLPLFGLLFRTLIWCSQHWTVWMMIITLWWLLSPVAPTYSHLMNCIPAHSLRRWLKFLKTKESFCVQHQALATSVTSSESNKGLSLLILIVTMALVVAKAKERITIAREIAIKGAEIAPLLQISIILPTGITLQELVLVRFILH